MEDLLQRASKARYLIPGSRISTIIDGKRRRMADRSSCRAQYEADAGCMRAVVSPVDGYASHVTNGWLCMAMNYRLAEAVTFKRKGLALRSLEAPARMCFIHAS